MNDLPKLKGSISQLSSEDLFKMVNDDIINYQKEEIALAYEELERRGMLPTPTNERPPIISPVGFLLGVIVIAVESILGHQSLSLLGKYLPWPRALAIAAFVALIASYWGRTKLSRSFWKHCLWSACLVLLGSLALWDLPNLLRQRIPVVLAFGIPAMLYGVSLYWLYEYYVPRSRQKD
jgi:hypothetical protein